MPQTDSLIETVVDAQDLAELDRVLGGSENLINRILRNALNRGVSRMRTVATRLAAKDTGLKSRTVRKRMKMRRASARRLTASLYVSGRGFPAIRFDVVQTEVGVVVRLRRKTTIAHAFRAMTRRGYEGVFRRRGKARLPIGEEYVEGPARVLRRLAKSKHVLDEGAATMRKRIPHELDRVLDRQKARAAAAEAGG